MELYYRRLETVRKGQTIPAQTETVVIYLPDVRSCVPTRIEWDALNVSYRRQLENVLKVSNRNSVERGCDCGGGRAPSKGRGDEAATAISESIPTILECLADDGAPVGASADPVEDSTAAETKSTEVNSLGEVDEPAAAPPNDKALLNFTSIFSFQFRLAFLEVSFALLKIQ